MNIADKKYKKKLAGNFCMYVNPTEHIQQQLFWYGYYEKELGDVISRLLSPGDVFVDIGANIGYFSLLAARQTGVQVFAFEPVSEVYDELLVNIGMNNTRNISAIRSAVGEANEEKAIFISGASNTGMSSFREPEDYSGKKQTVRVVSLDSWITGSGPSKIDLIKIDVEGSELAVLKGARTALENHKPLIIAEINPSTLVRFGLQPIDIFSYLSGLNYIGFEITKKGLIRSAGATKLKETVNVLFIHQEKKSRIDSLTN